ncbi:MAG: helix-turn-helix domain-containing protein [Acidobacteriaceae bacterium]|jgi:transcriptional regulator with XRE-family HTH domain|nr:helix-turn-helix domain-containing protein [Acidobacteriaceae bacterium]
MQVQKLRLQRGWSQQQLAELSGLSVRTIQRIENGQTASTETLKSLAAVFEVDFSTLSSEEAMPTSCEAMPTSSAVNHEEQLALFKVRKLKGFYVHLAQYILVIAGLAVLNLITSPHNLWFYWPAFGWGIGILAHAASVFQWMPFFGAEWEKKQVEKHLGRPL